MFYPRRKYHNVKTEIDGEKFDSKLEARFFTQYLSPLAFQNKWTIYRQKPYELRVNGKMVTKYIADFEVVRSENDKEIYECKGFMTPDAQIKLRLFSALTNIPVTIVYSLSRMQALTDYGKRKNSKKPR